MSILKIEKLTKKYGKTYALNGLDMEVKKGDIYGFVGPNGAGKTTTLRIISGLLKSDGGDLWLDGVRTTKNILKQKSLIGFVPDFFGVYENLNVIEYLEFFAASYGIYGRAGTVRAREVLEMVELSGKEEQMVDSLSRGIQQRLCLARAMIHKPKLLVLDEPNSGLDPRSRKDFQLLLQRLAREDYTILISSHILSELADLCTSIGVINGGVMVQQGKLENIMLAIDSSNPLRITVLNQVPKALELLRQDPQVSRLSVDENKIAAWFSGSREEEAYLLQKLVDAGNDPLDQENGQGGSYHAADVPPGPPDVAEGGGEHDAEQSHRHGITRIKDRIRRHVRNTCFLRKAYSKYRSFNSAYFPRGTGSSARESMVMAFGTMDLM